MRKKRRRVAGLGWLERAHFVHDVQSKEPVVLYVVRRSLMRVRECMADEQIGIDKGYRRTGGGKLDIYPSYKVGSTPGAPGALR